MTRDFRIGFAMACCLAMQFDHHAVLAQLDSTSVSFVYDPVIHSPAYLPGTGPVIYLDEGHFNRHMYGGLGSFIAFRNVLVKDGYRVISFRDQFTNESLAEIEILVIALPQNEKNLDVSNWRNPTYSAFDQNEITALTKWVEDGGSLFLIFDHHPFAGAVETLANAFGFELMNGHAIDNVKSSPHYFNRAEKTLRGNVLTNGRDSAEQVDSIITFSGAAFTIPPEATPVLLFDKDWSHFLTDRAWDFRNVQPTSIEGFAQGAYRQFGQGRIVIFGDGNTFSAQVDQAGNVAGFIHPYAWYNYKLLLNSIHYLDGLLD